MKKKKNEFDYKFLGFLDIFNHNIYIPTAFRLDMANCDIVFSDFIAGLIYRMRISRRSNK